MVVRLLRARFKASSALIYVHLRRSPREGQLAARLDHLIDEKPLVPVAVLLLFGPDSKPIVGLG